MGRARFSQRPAALRSMCEVAIASKAYVPLPFIAFAFNILYVSFNRRIQDEHTWRNGS
jgi:hypothetical protein